MVWSYSRIKAFESCPYGFFLKYIDPEKKKKPHKFFSDYGSFIHKIIEMRFKELITDDEAIDYYLSCFKSEVRGTPPNQKIFKKYFENGLNYFQNFKFPPKNTLYVELNEHFMLGRFKFVGVIDHLYEQDGQLILSDNKSRTLKPRSGRAKPTVADNELDEYLRQLYLYSIPVYQKLGRFPDKLQFNCFRTPELITEPFIEENFEKAKEWAVSAIEKIEDNKEWKPDMEYWKCSYLCDMCDHCEYYQLNNKNRGRK